MKVYWHRELPPLQAVPLGEHTIEADSVHVPRAIVNPDTWQRCANDLARGLEVRLSQEGVRLGGACAHVLDEHIDVKRDAARDEAWLHGRYTYMLYR